MLLFSGRKEPINPGLFHDEFISTFVSAPNGINSSSLTPFRNKGNSKLYFDSFLPSERGTETPSYEPKNHCEYLVQMESLYHSSLVKIAP